jgi:catechol 2,3-dioxygenase-like lactoylglutathione lyase family enzyme
VGVTGFDHVAIPMERTEAMLAFYRALGFRVHDATPPFYSFHFGDQKVHLHGPELWKAAGFTLRGPTAQPGCADLCFVWEGGLEPLRRVLDAAGAELVEGPVERIGGRERGTARGTSVYVRDPDTNLLEFIVYS